MYIEVIMPGQNRTIEARTESRLYNTIVWSYGCDNRTKRSALSLNSDNHQRY